MIHSRIEDLRKRQQPTLFLPYTPTRIEDADGDTYERRVSFEWFEQVPGLVAVSVIEPKNGEEIVWSISRILFDLVEVEPGQMFRVDDVSAKIERPHWMWIGLHATIDEFAWVRADLARLGGWLGKIRLVSPSAKITRAIRMSSRVN